MPTRAADARTWADEGTDLLLGAVDSLSEEQYDAPTLLPRWTRRHLVAHVAGYADALGRLMTWARTGSVTPMYASPEERRAGIERGATMDSAAVVNWLTDSCARLREAMDALPEERWQAEVVTAQGRTVPASEVPWMRAREVFVHAVDLDRGVGFADLPTDFLSALIADIRAKRGLDQLPAGPLPEVAAWLAGRPHHLPDAPDLGPWL
jgi:maleylpyruvate isomerase